MELNDLSHVHFIQAIRGGLVSKIINMNSLGRPALKFKPLKSIYESEHSNNISSGQQKAAIYGSPFRSDRFKSEMTMGDYEEISPADISLGEIKRRCKAKRRKFSELKNHDKDTYSSPSDIYSETSYTGEQRKEDEDEADFDLPISIWKLKLSKKSKLKQRCFQKFGFTSQVCQEAFPEKIPHSPQESSQTVENIHTHSDVKIKRSESLDDVVNLADGSICMSDSDMGYSGFLSHEVPRWLNGEEQTSSAKASSTSLCIVHEPIDTKLEPLGTDDNVISVTDTYLYMSCSDMDSGEDKYHIPSTFNGNESRSGILTSVTEETPSCVINEIPFECLETGKSTFLIEKSSSCAVNEEPSGHLEFVTPLCLPVDDVGIVKEIADVELPQLSCQDYPFSPVLESDNEGLSVGDAEIEGITDVELMQLSSQDSPSPELEFKNEGLSISDAEIVKGVTDVELQQLSSHESPSPVLEFKNEDRSISDAEIVKGVTDVELQQLSSQDSPSSPEMNSMNENLTVSDAEIVKGITDVELQLLNSHVESKNEDDVGATIDEPVSDLVEVLDCSTVTSPDATNRVAVMEVLEDHHGRKLDYPPKRLFSARKAISPSSQEKLLQAVDADELCDKIKPSRIRNIGPTDKINPDGVLKKRKIMKNGSAQLVPKGILKTPNVSFMIPHQGSECASIQTCADKAVAFTQRQMHDIEGLAMMLMKQLKSMKEIVEHSLLTETLQTDSCSSTQLKYTVDKMRISTENAAEAEETTRKWLSMMSKDCNRFCKILKTTEMKAAAASPPPSSYEVHKKRRKVTFADETGGILCQIKIFEDHHESLLVPESEMTSGKTKIVEVTCTLQS